MHGIRIYKEATAYKIYAKGIWEDGGKEGESYKCRMG
jgi:hypothetical protein